MKNKMNTLYNMSHIEAFSILENIKNNPNIFFAELQGRRIQSWNDYSLEIEKAFHFPSSCRDSIDRYLDWIRDISWLDEGFSCSRYVLIIYDFSLMLLNDIPTKKMIKDDFIEIILPWWDGEVENCVLGGKRKQFDVYLID